jgi:hypothetical protein
VICSNADIMQTIGLISKGPIEIGLIPIGFIAIDFRLMSVHCFSVEGLFFPLDILFIRSLIV